MTDRNRLLKKLSKNVYLGGLVSINDLRDKEQSGQPMTGEEKDALRNFDRYRIKQLNAQTSDAGFHEMYRKLQAMANLSQFTEFLKDEYL